MIFHQPLQLAGKFRVAIVEKGERRANLAEAQVWMSRMNFRRVPAVGRFIHRHLDDLDVGVADPGDLPSADGRAVVTRGSVRRIIADPDSIATQRVG